MKGIVLAGGAGTRLHPLTMVASKQLQPVYDKPMIYYPLSTLMLGGLDDLLLISTPNDVPRFEALLGDGSQWGVSLSYAVQTAPRGIADSLLVGEKFLDGDSVSLVLGDNIFYGRIGFDDIVRDFREGAVIFGYPVQDPHRYGIVEFGDGGEVLSLEEKPAHPRSNLAVPGIYVYDADAVAIVKDLRPSSRGELEITDLNLEYHRRRQLRAVRLGRGVAWLDSGTHESLLESANFIATIERRQGLKIACLEEVAYRQGFIDAEGLEAAAAAMPPSPYRTYVLSLLDDEVVSGVSGP
jgi:glucose-1-phosphate thymidylyltransferase